LARLLRLLGELGIYLKLRGRLLKGLEDLPELAARATRNCFLEPLVADQSLQLLELKPRAVGDRTTRSARCANGDVNRASPRKGGKKSTRRIRRGRRGRGSTSAPTSPTASTSATTRISGATGAAAAGGLNDLWRAKVDYRLTPAPRGWREHLRQGGGELKGICMAKPVDERQLRLTDTQLGAGSGGLRRRVWRRHHFHSQHSTILDHSKPVGFDEVPHDVDDLATLNRLVETKRDRTGTKISVGDVQPGRFRERRDYHPDLLVLEIDDEAIATSPNDR
jgi:hypothetical protein